MSRARRSSALVASVALAACRRAPPAEDRAPAPSASVVASGPTVAAPLPSASPEPLLPLLPMARLAAVPEGHAPAVPGGCVALGPARAASLAGSAGEVVAAGGAPDQLAAVEVDDAGVATRGALLTFAGEARPSSPRALPASGGARLLAAESGTWVALLDRPLAPPHRELLLWREPGAWSRLAEGDALTAVDLVCSGGGAPCVALSTRAAGVAAGGASVWRGAPGGAWSREDLAPPLVAGDARPWAVAFAGKDEVDVALLEGAGLQVVGLPSSGPPSTRARIPLSVVPLDVGVVGAEKVAVAVVPRSAPDADGCAALPGLTLVRSRGEPVILATTAPARAAQLRPLARGAVLVWVAPVSCRQPWQSVVHAVRLDEAGAPAGAEVPVADATGFSLATRGDQLDLVLRTRDEATWLRARCE